jgi:Ser/Thr protein kinase RdoA (MazF antagonist)
MIKIKGLLLKAENDNVYAVHDQNGRLGSIVKIYIPQDPYPSAKKMFHAFGENFETLADAVSEFLKIKSCKPYES